MRRLSFKRFCDEAEKENCPENLWKRLYSHIGHMDQKLLSEYLNYLDTGVCPEIEAEGITLAYLMNEYQKPPIKAFLIMDGLIRHPQKTLYRLQQIHYPMPPLNEEEKQRLAGWMSEHGTDLTPPAEPEPQEIILPDTDEI